MSDVQYLKPKEVAAYFGVTLATVRRWVKSGKLIAIETPGGHSRIIAKDFYAMLHESGLRMSA